MASRRITADRAFGLIFTSDDNNDDFSFSSEEDDLSDFSCFTIFGHVEMTIYGHIWSLRWCPEKDLFIYIAGVHTKDSSVCEL